VVQAVRRSSPNGRDLPWSWSPARLGAEWTAIVTSGTAIAPQVSKEMRTGLDLL
jgi:hypothetical protein